MSRLTNRQLDVAIGAIVALFLFGVLAAAATLVLNSRRDALAAAKEQAVRALSGAEAALNRGMLSVDVMLADTRSLLYGATGNGDGLDVHEAERLLRVAANQNILVRHVSLVRPDASVLASSDPSAARLGLPLPAGFLDEIGRQPVPTLAIGSPLVHPATSNRVLYFARRVQLATGVEVIALAEVQAPMLANMMAQGVHFGNLEITLERDDGELLASVPPDERKLGGSLPPLRPAPLSPGPVEEAASRLSGQPALIAARSTLYRNILLVAGVPHDGVLAEWRAKRNAMVAGAALFTLLIVGTGVLTRWYLRRLRAARVEIARSRHTLNQALEAMTTGFLLVDADGTVAAWNRRLFVLYPWLESALAPGLPYRSVLEATAAHVPVGAAGREAWVEQALALHRQAEGEHEQILADGRVLRVSERRTPGGGTVCIVWDVTGQKQLEVELRIAATAFESHESILITDAAGVILRVNRAFSEATGYGADEAIGQTPRLLQSGRHDRAFYDAMWKELDDNGVWQGEIWNRRKNGVVFPEWLTITAVTGEGGAVSHYVATMTDLSARKAAEEEIQKLAYYDPLTRLPNRRMLVDRLHRALAMSARNGRDGALLLIDLDNFKTLNDTLGHDVGDMLLQQVAQRLTGCVREGDTVARLGGDEFVVILQDLGGDTREAAFRTEATAMRMLGSLNQPFLLGEHEHTSTPSIGAALFTDHRITPEGLMKRADIAMYQAKKAGRNTFRFFDPDMQAAVEARAELERGLTQALALRQFQLYYQPQVDGDHCVHGAEALLRWMHPVRGLVPPNEFIPLAEESGLVVGIGAWVLENACARLKLWEADPCMRHLDLAVNVSARQFRHPAFVDQVVGAVRDSGINPQRLKLEMTETLLHEDIGETIARMNTLRAIGVRFSMDDFGTGYSSLSNLKKLPLDQLKIDKSFVADVACDPDDLVIVQTIIAMAYNLGMQVIAEGVETEEQRELLLRRGCSHFQGYLFGRPMPVDEFEAMVEQRAAAGGLARIRDNAAREG